MNVAVSVQHLLITSEYCELYFPSIFPYFMFDDSVAMLKSDSVPM
jgi:hypothetical protein